MPRRLHVAALALTTAATLAACAPAGATGDAARGAVVGTPTAAAPFQVAPLADVVPLEPAPVPLLPVTVVGEDGEAVTVTSADRILAVDLYGTLAEIVFSLGLGDHVVGRDSSTGFAAAQHLPLVTVGGHTLSAEAVLDLDPTVVLADSTIGPAEVLDQLAGAGVAVVRMDPTRTIEGIGPQIQAVADALGVPEAGRALAAGTVERLDDAVRQVERVEGARVAFLYLRGSAVALLGGPGSGADELITALGAEDAGTAAGLPRSFVPITSEALVGAAPDVLLLLEGGLATVAGLDGLLAVPGVAQTPAGQAGRVVTVADTELLTFGPRTPEVLESLADALDLAMREGAA